MNKIILCTLLVLTINVMFCKKKFDVNLSQTARLLSSQIDSCDPDGLKISRMAYILTSNKAVLANLGKYLKMKYGNSLMNCPLMHGQSQWKALITVIAKNEYLLLGYCHTANGNIFNVRIY